MDRAVVGSQIEPAGAPRSTQSSYNEPWRQRLRLQERLEPRLRIIKIIMIMIIIKIIIMIIIKGDRCRGGEESLTGITRSC